MIDRCEGALQEIAQSRESPDMSDAETALHVAMLEENLQWARGLLFVELTRRPWQKLPPWRPPRPTISEMLSSNVAHGVFELSRRKGAEGG